MISTEIPVALRVLNRFSFPISPGLMVLGQELDLLGLSVCLAALTRAWHGSRSHVSGAWDANARHSPWHL